MHQSHIIEVSGQFAGAAMTHGDLFRFIAVDPRVAELDRSLWPSLPDVRRVVGHLLITGQLPTAKLGRLDDRCTTIDVLSQAA